MVFAAVPGHGDRRSPRGKAIPRSALKPLTSDFQTLEIAQTRNCPSAVPIALPVEIKVLRFA